jgi:hypothetical protein
VPYQPSNEISNEELVKKLRDAKVVDPDYTLTATKGSDEVVINTQRNPDLDESKIKVQAVLIAKTALDNMPASVVRAKIVFADKNIEEVVPINRQVLALYASRKLTERDLLALVDMTKTEAAKKRKFGEPTDEDLKKVRVVDGSNKVRRAIQQAKINILRQSGTDVSRLQAIFDAQEKLAARAGTQAQLGELELSIEHLGVLIREQFEMLVEARNPSLRRWPGRNHGAQSRHTPNLTGQASQLK